MKSDRGIGIWAKNQSANRKSIECSWNWLKKYLIFSSWKYQTNRDILWLVIELRFVLLEKLLQTETIWITSKKTQGNTCLYMCNTQPGQKFWFTTHFSSLFPYLLFIRTTLSRVKDIAQEQMWIISNCLSTFLLKGKRKQQGKISL